MAATMQTWRHLTHPDGMTVSLLVTATGMTKDKVRAELRTLERDRKVKRERAPVGKEHLWWRATHYPLSDLTVITAMGLAAKLHPSPSRLRAVLQRLSTRAGNPGIRSVLSLCATAKQPHRIVRDAVGRCAQ